MAAPAPLMKFTVEAGKYDRVDTPVSASLAGSDADKPYRLEEIVGGEGRPVASQVEAGQPPMLWFILSGKTPAGAERHYEVLSGPSAAPAAGIEIRDIKDTSELAVGKVLRYHYGVIPPPEDVDKKFAHGANMHPVLTPAGVVVTDDYPADHRHQRGIWFSWTKTEFEGRHVDFWNLGDGTGAIRCIGTPVQASGPVFSEFLAKHDYLDRKAPEGEKVVLKENFKVRVWNIGGPQKAFLWDLVATQRCATAGPLKLPKYYYGGLGYRGPLDWMKNCNMLTSEGKTRKDGNETKGRWCDVSGESGGKAAGVLIMSHPQNFRHPEPLRLNPQQPQICFAPSQEGEWSIEPGKDYVWRYRFCVHDGEVKADEASRLWADFGEPPAVRVQP